MSRRVALPLVLLAATAAVAVPPEDPNAPPPAKGSPEEALLAVQVDKGLKVTVWAAEPLMANPVSFCFDEQGRAYVAETTRFDKGVPDTRGHMYWLDDDLACRTVAERVEMYGRTYGDHKPYLGFEQYDDQVRVVWDATGKGKADKSNVFSKGYNRPEDGLGSGLLARRGSVYYTNIPSLYKLRDTKGANAADEKQVLSTGYGVRVQYLGHDLHGLRMGPDGKLYFSIGDRGLNVKTMEGKQLVNTESGAVLRCDPDGKNLEIVHTGLRNPQELAFDDFGNLFTYDNNCDSGDSARWVQIVEGGDSGWRCGYQYGTYYHLPGVPQGNRGPWNSEKIWHVPGPDGGPPAYVVPPLKHFGNGPSGITHYPGVGLGDRYQDHFFCCDFTSNPSGSKIWSLAVKPKGASFEVTDLHPFVQGMVPTDCEFGPDGAFYWSDWVGGWNPPGKGRIFRVTDPEAMKNPKVAEAKKILADGFEKRGVDELLKLLEFPHQLIRNEAQFELVNRAATNNRGEPSVVTVKKLGELAGQSPNKLARLHAIWALGTIARGGDPSALGLLTLMSDPDAEIRAQTARVLGWVPTKPDDGKNVARDLLARAMATDPEPRVRFFAAQSYGRITKMKVVPDLTKPILVGGAPEWTKILPLLDLLKANNDADPYLRAAAVAGIVTVTSEPRQVLSAWKAAGKDYDSPAVRLGVLLALRRLESPDVANFLNPNDPRELAEAARAIHDVRIAKALPELADLAGKSGLPDAASYRALSACYHLGTPEAAALVAKFAARSGEPDHARVFALKVLGDWSNPPRRDPVTGLALDLPKRHPLVPMDALRPVLANVFSGSDAVRAEAAKVASTLGLKEVGPLLAGLVKDAKAPVSTRVDALYGLSSLKDPAVNDLAAFALASDQPRLRAAGRSVNAKLNPGEVLKELPALLTDPKTSMVERQGAFEILAALPASPEADALLDDWLDLVNHGKVPAELILDVVEAAETRTKTPKLKLYAPLRQKVDEFRRIQEKIAADAKGDKLALYLDVMAGGDAEKGRFTFLNNSAVYCQRCHKLDGQGGDVGPPLNGIAAQMGKDRRYLLESVVLPSATIAKGYETAVLTLADGRVVSGVVKEETKKQIRLVTPENKELVIPLDDVEARRTGPSAMPDDLHKKLSRRELRDLVEFLASLKEPEKKGDK
jgi:quinoprotein glucose dehydrogenase